jgi:hypothetical protein
MFKIGNLLIKTFNFQGLFGILTNHFFINKFKNVE